MGRFNEKTYDGGVREILDSENDYTIWYREPYGYVAYDNKTGNEVYRMSSDGAASYYLDDGSTVILDKKMSLEDIHRDMTFTGLDGYEYSVRDGQHAKKITEYSEANRFYTIENNENVTVVIDRVNKYKIESEKQGTGSTRYYVYNENGDIVFETNKSIQEKQCFTNINIDGCMTQLKDRNISYEELVDKIANNSDITLFDDSVLSLVDGKPDKITVYNSDGSISIYDPDSYASDPHGKLRQVIKADGTVYDYNLEKDSQVTSKNGMKTYSKINHIEYDEEAYNAILNSFNSIGSSYSGSISSECSSIESAVNSFPDSYSASGISDIGSTIEGHISLISSLSEMTNYSLLAYQTCDESLRDGLYTLIDNIFGESENNIANYFKSTISNSIEDRNNDGILEYKEKVNFKSLSKRAFVTSTYTDDSGNIWYLNSNNTVIGVEGNNLKIDFGGEKFSISYDNGIMKIKDANGNDLNIFGEYNLDSNQFGGDQGRIASLLYSDNDYIEEILDKYIPGASTEQKNALFTEIAKTSCGKIALTNLVFKKFQGKESEFQDTFGYPMYDIKFTGSNLTIDYNYETLAVDLCCKSENVRYEDGDVLFTSAGSVLTGSVDYDYNTNYTSNLGTSYKSRTSMEDYLKSEYNVSLDGYDQSFIYHAERGYTLYNMDGSVYTTNGGAHAMIEVGKTEDGRPIVSSWGKKFILEPSTNPDDNACLSDRNTEYI